MALNFLGLGFSLGAQDKGLSAAIKTTTAGLADISKSIVGISAASAAMVFKAPDFGAAIGHANQLAGDIKLTTTSLEAMGVANNKVTSAGLAGLKMSEKEYAQAQGKISGYAITMNTGADALTKSFTAAHQAGISFNEMGFSSLLEYQKVMEVTGTSGEKFAASMGKAKQKFGTNAKLLQQLTGEVLAFGKANNRGREALGGMSATIDLLDENMTQLPQNWDKQGVAMAKFVRGTEAVAAAYQAAGLSSVEAGQASQALAKNLLDNGKGLEALYTGLENDFPDAAALMTKHLGNHAEAFKMLSESPDKFMLQIGKITDEVGKLKGVSDKNLSSLRLGFGKTFGADAVKVLDKGGFAKMGPILAKAQDHTDGAADAVKDMAAKYKDGRTMAERFALAMDRVQTKLKQVKGVMSDSEYLSTYNKQSNDFLKTVNKLAGKGGALGKLTTSMIEIKNHGFGGFIASKSTFGFALAEGIKLIQPMLEYLPLLKFALSALLSPLGLVTAAFLVFADLGRGKDSFIKPMIDKFVKQAPVFFKKVGEFFSQLFTAIYDVLKKVDWEKVGNSIWSGLAWALGGIVKVVGMVDWARVGEVLGVALQRTVEFAFVLAFKAIDLFGRFLDWFLGLDWGRIGNSLGKIIAGMFALAVDAVWTVIKRIPAMFVAVIDLVLGALDGIVAAIKTKFPLLGAFLEPFVAIIKTVLVPALIALGIHFLAVGVKAVYSAMTSAAAWVKASYQTVAASYTSIAAQAKLVYAYLATKVASMQTGLAMAKAWVIGLGPIAWVVAAVVGLGVVIYKFGDDILAFFSWLWGGIKTAAKAAWDLITFWITLPIRIIQAAWGVISGFFSGLWNGIKSVASGVWNAIKFVITSPIEAVKAAWNAIKGFFGGLWDGIKGVASGIWNGIKAVITSPITAVKAAWGAIKGFFSGLWDGIKGAASSAWGWIKDKVSGAADAISGAAKTSFDAVSTASKTMSGNLKTNIIGSLTDVKNAAGDGKITAAVRKMSGDVKTDLEKTNKDVGQSAKDALNTVSGTSGKIKEVTVASAKASGDAVIGANEYTARTVDGYVNKTDGHLKKASKLVFPKLGGDELLDDYQVYLTKKHKLEEGYAYQRSREGILALSKDRDAHVRHAEKQNALHEETQKLSAEMEKKHGVAASVMLKNSASAHEAFGEVGRRAQKQLDEATRNSFMEKVSQSENYYTREIANQMLLQQQARDAGKESDSYYGKIAQLRTEATGAANKFTWELKAMSDGLNSTLSIGGDQARFKSEASINAWVTQFQNASKEFGESFGSKSEASKEVRRGLANIDAAFSAAMFKMNSEAQDASEAIQKKYKALNDPAGMKKALTELAENLGNQTTETEKFFANQKKTFKDNVDGYKASIIGAVGATDVGLTKIITGMVESTDKALAESTRKATETATKNANVTGKIVQEGFNLGAGEVADTVARIAVINPEDFRKGIRTIKTETMTFLKSLDGEAQKLVKDIGTTLKKYFEDQKKGWNDQETLIKTFSEKGAAHTEKYWTKVIAEAERATGAFTKLFGAIQSNLMSMAKSVNVMDLLASPSQISQWAASVVSALAYAFKTGGAVDELITKSYQKALEANSRLQTGGAATPDTASMTSPAVPATSAQSMLLKVIDKPAWASEGGDIPRKLDKMNEQLKAAVAELKTIAHRKPGSTTPSAPKIP